VKVGIILLTEFMYEAIDKNQYTPMMRQYLTIKENYPDTLVFFRLGDFYEMFFNDAIVASRELEIVLTGRDAGTGGRNRDSANDIYESGGGSDQARRRSNGGEEAFR
jgi:hypothetical protein